MVLVGVDELHHALRERRKLDLGPPVKASDELVTWMGDQIAKLHPAMLSRFDLNFRSATGMRPAITALVM